ncbi:MAG: YIP1 family protein [Lachnospiraceae bacterium]
MKISKKFLRLMTMLLAVVFLTSGIAAVPALAETPYRTYTMDGYGRVMETQTAYLPNETIIKFGEEFLNSPNDLFITDEGEIYVADTGNSRIVVGNEAGELVKIIGEGILNTPRGVFVTDDKHVYVADSEGMAVYEFDENGNKVNEYGKPDSPLYGDNIEYKPSKLVVNDAGIMYIICASNTNGIVEISPDEGGTFLGYFGANAASKDPMLVLRRAIATEAQRAKMVSNIPSTPDNLAIDEKGLIYTVTRGEKYDSLRRLNIAGKNLITNCDAYDESPGAVATGNHDNVYVASTKGYVYEYNNQGELLFVFGAKDDGSQRVGLSTQVTSIKVDTHDNIYLLDSEKNQIQVYRPSEFTSLLHNALYLYSKGRYTESKEPLEQVLKMNSMFDYANKAMGRALFQEENYDLATDYARLAKDYSGYSDAFWEIRNNWLKRNIVTLIISIIVLYILIKVLKYMDRKKGIFNKPREIWKSFYNNKIFSNVMYAKYFMRHPSDGSYGIAREGRASFLAPSIILVIFIAEYVINKYLCGFLQKTIREGRYELVSDIGTIIVVITGVTLCNYLVCTINEGEGTVKKIYTYFCYSLMPYVILTPVSFVLSHMVTNNEAFLITLVEVVMYGWIIVLMILAIQGVNNYTAQETFKIICLSIFTILIVALLIFIIYVLWAQVFEFISAIIGEVVYRLGN